LYSAPDSFPTRRSSDLGVEPHGAGQFATVDEVVEHHLLRRAPQASGEPVDDEEHARLQQLQGIGEEQYAPAQGHDHEHDLPDLEDRKSTRLNSSHVSIS